MTVTVVGVVGAGAGLVANKSDNISVTAVAACKSVESSYIVWALVCVQA